MLKTTHGDIEITLDLDKAPKTSANFLEYVSAGFYNDTIFHRVIADFMIQGGGFVESMDRKTTDDPIKNEANNGLKNDKGTIAMARTNDPHSATSQFFINLKDNDFLNFRDENMQGWGYAVFGKVSQGIEVVEAIGQTKTGVHMGMKDVPVEPVVIHQAMVIEDTADATPQESS
nr:peptidylprolyl isomerase [Ostreibacterium oceani]